MVIYVIMAKWLGKLKKISIIDAVAIAICIVVLSAGYFMFKRKVEPIIMRVKITDDNALYAKTLPGEEFANSFIVGDTEKDEAGRVVSEITSVDAYKVKSDQTVVYLNIKTNAVYNPNNNTYTIQGKNVAFGETFLFSLSKVKFRGLVVDFPGFRDQGVVKQTKTIVLAQLRDSSRFYSDTYGVAPYLANAVKKNDAVTNSKREVLLKVLDVSVKPAMRTITNNARTYQALDPELKDVFYTIELTTKQLNGQVYMFDYQPVIIGALVPINLPTVSVFPTIIEIQR